ncbi:hypothetical protein DFH94DRAFT_686401 [Russula ochroleuca]|uniref:methylisocitrate lyase n=1 Tax=Russula ochroleuca TaxID=152965 RepID=A0A9P5MMW3_9AGAM|nr:hypothetical protein DFH94DRAFT_686401 [Russula ochroleuca]
MTWRLVDLGYEVFIYDLKFSLNALFKPLIQQPAEAVAAPTWTRSTAESYSQANAQISGSVPCKGAQCHEGSIPLRCASSKTEREGDSTQSYCRTAHRILVSSCEELVDARSEANPLGGLHSNGYISDLFAKAFEIEGMKAYVELIERKERELARTCSSIKRQELLRRQPNDGGVSSTAAMGKESRKPGLRRLNYDMRRRSWVELGR